jgi:CRP-like cAMP-binding protein
LNIDLVMIGKNKLFENISLQDMKTMLPCLSATVRTCRKDTFFMMAGDRMKSVGILMSGRLAIIKERGDGARTMIDEVVPPESFGEAFACAGMEKSPVSVIALEDSQVLLIDLEKIVAVCSSACTYHNKLIENMLGLLAGKLLSLTGKLDIISKRTTRDKLLAFLEQQKMLANSSKFTIPFNREQLAEYLFIDRSAMSSELGKLRDEGLIRFKKNQFEWLAPLFGNKGRGSSCG